MKKVLIFSYFFPPMGGVEVQRVTRFVRQLPEFGWMPVVVTSKGASCNAYDESLLADIPKGVDIIRLRAINHPSVVHRSRLLEEGVDALQEFRRSRKLRDRFRRRLEAYDRKYLCFPDPMNWWAQYTGLQINRLCKRYKPALLWATGYPWSTLSLLARATVKTEIPAVGDIRDPWSWHPQGFWKDNRHRDLERTILHKLAHIVTVTDGFKKKYVDLYPGLKDRFSTIRNCFVDTNKLPVKAQFTPTTFSYLGSLTTGNLKDMRRRTLDTFLNALHLCVERDVPGTDQIRVLIAGRGVEKTQTLIDEYGLGDCATIAGNLTYDAANEMRATADVMLMVMGTGAESNSFVPLKLYEYLAANRPILALLPEGSEAGEIILKKKRGVVCRIDDVADIARGIELLLKNDFEYDPDSDISEYSCHNSTEKLARLFDSIVAKQSE